MTDFSAVPHSSNFALKVPPTVIGAQLFKGHDQCRPGLVFRPSPHEPTYSDENRGNYSCAFSRPHCSGLRAAVCLAQGTFRAVLRSGKGMSLRSCSGTHRAVDFVRPLRFKGRGKKATDRA